MRDRKLQTKRQSKTGFRALYAQTVKRKQRATTAASDELEGDVPSVGIGRALTIILVLHIVAIAAIWVGINWKGDASPETHSAVTTINDKESDENKVARTGEEVAAPGRLTTNTPESYNLENTAVTTNQMDYVSDRPSIEVANNATNASPSRQPRVIKPKRNPNLATAPASAVGAKQYVVVSGDTIYNIAKKYNVEQSAITAINAGLVPSKLSIGQRILIPAN